MCTAHIVQGLAIPKPHDNQTERANDGNVPTTPYAKSSPLIPVFVGYKEKGAKIEKSSEAPTGQVLACLVLD
jgi:hypothetical protein